MTVRQTIDYMHTHLSDRYPSTETESFIRILFRHYLGMGAMEMYLHPDKEVPDEIQNKFTTAVDELRENKPIQYITGETEFYGLKFHLTPDVLIPRPETEELVEWVISEYSSGKRKADLKILDIGTGSGCIAVALASHLSFAEVWATDVSEAALRVAEKNAETNRVSIKTVQGDILSESIYGYFSEACFDVIISNPPYITRPEKELMKPNVLDYEPHHALFPQGENPFIFYEQIAKFGLRHLNNRGKLFFEINEAFPDEIKDIMKKYRYEDIILKKDMNDKWRMLACHFLPDTH